MSSDTLRRTPAASASDLPLSRRILILPRRDLMDRIEAGSFYEIIHSALPSDASPVLYLLRAVMVTAKTEKTVTIRFPSVQSLKAFFGKMDRLAIRSTLYPSTDEKYVMELGLAVAVLGHQIPSREFVAHRHSRSFWLIKDYKRQQMELSNNGGGGGCDFSARNGACFSTLQRSGIGWGTQQIQLVQSSVVKPPAAVDDADAGDDADADADAGDDEDEDDVEDVVEEAVSGVAVNDVVKEEEEDEEEEEDIREVEVKLEETPVDDDDDDDVKVKDIIQYSRKRKRGRRPVRSQYAKKRKGNPKSKPLEVIPKVEGNKGGDRVDRWSATRYEAAVKELVEVLKANKAFFSHPISRATLRNEARKRVGDTGLLDHLLKHLAGKVVPSGGSERLRRRCDANGKMEYWLENADLANIRKEAGIKDPYWTPPPGWKRGDSISVHNCVCCKEVRLMKDELNSLKRKLTDRKVKDEKHQAITVLPPESAVVCNSNATNVKESYELLVKKKSAVEEQLHTMSKVLKELEEEMKVLSSKREVEANRKPPIITYSKSRKAKVMDVTDRTSTEDLPEETSEETSDDDEDDFERDGQVTKMLRPIRLRACRVSKMTKSHAVKSAREAVVDRWEVLGRRYKDCHGSDLERYTAYCHVQGVLHRDLKPEV